MKINFDSFSFQLCKQSDIDEIMEIQAEAFAIMDNKDWLRKNTKEMLLTCLNPPHITLGAWYSNILAGFAILYFPDDGVENLAKYVTKFDASSYRSANYKLCIVREQFRGNSLQYEFGRRLEKYALEKGMEILCATVSPDNIYSRQNILRLGYEFDSLTEKYGLSREIYCKVLNNK